MAQSGGSEAVSCISSEEDLQRMIELGSWYDSEEESSSEAEDTDSGSDRNHDEVWWDNPIYTLDLDPRAHRPLLGLSLGLEC